MRDRRRWRVETMWLMILTLLALAMPVHAGSRGYYLAFVDVSSAQQADGVELMLALRQSAVVEGRDCWACEKRGHDAGLGILYLKKLPAGVNADSVKAALEKGGVALTALRQRLRDFADDDGTRLDGLYAYQRQGGSVTIYAVSPRDGVRVSRMVVLVKGRIRASDLDAILEKLSKTLPFVP